MSDLRADPLFILSVLLLLVVCSAWLARRGAFRYFGSALIVLLLGAIVANVGIIPAGSTPDAPVPVYHAIFTYVAPIAIFWLLLPVNLRDVLQAGLPLIALCLWVARDAGRRRRWHVARPGRNLHRSGVQAIASMFTGTYIGGSAKCLPDLQRGP